MLLSLLEQAGNRVLEVDHASRERVAKLSGRCIALNIRHVDITVFLYPGPEGIRIAHGAENVGDVTLIGPPSVFAQIASRGLDEISYSPGELEIQGDALLAQEFARILGNLNIDWEELLARQTGDIPARFISRQFSAALGWARETESAIKQNLAEYIAEEARIAASRQDVDRFLNDVDEIRSDVDRLSARLASLTQRSTGEAR